MKTLFPAWMFCMCGAALALWGQTPPDPKPSTGEALIDSDFEASDAAWPDGWPQPDGASWETEGGNRFLRLRSQEPGQTLMFYREIGIPEGTEALELSFRVRVSGLQRGENSWFDARFMLEWMDAARGKVSPRPPNPNWGKDTDGWQQKVLRFNVPTEAATLKFMPSLLQVAAGTLDLDDVMLRPIAKLAPEEDPATRRRLEQEAKAQARRDKAAKVLAAEGSVIPNGDFENKRGASAKGAISYPEEDGNTFLRITSEEPDQLYMQYMKVDLPAGAEAMELSWRWRVTDLKPGPKAWYDARFMTKLLDGSGKKTEGQSPDSYTRKSTKGWQERSIRFLVPEDAVSMEIMPSLFQVKSGVLDVDDLVLKPTDAEDLRTAMAARKRERARLTVDPEEPRRENWPAPLHVDGNRLRDPQGNEVWLQGVSIASLEWSMGGENILKSCQVAIEEWGANCIRLPMKEQYWYDEDGGEKYRKLIDDAITYTANRGAYLVLDLHRYRAPRPEHLEFWKDAAERYKNHPAVLFDLLNEPHGTSWEVWRNGGFVATKTKQADEDAFLTEAEKRKNAEGFESVGMQGLVDAVRATGATNIVVVGGLDWAYDLSGILKGYAIDDPLNNVMYASHVYPWKRNWQKSFLDVAEKYPIFLGEVGADAKKMTWMPAEIQEDWQTWVPRMLHTIQEYRLNYTAWCFHPSASPRMLVDWTYEPTPFWGKQVKEALAGKPFSPDPIPQAEPAAEEDFEGEKKKTGN